MNPMQPADNLLNPQTLEMPERDYYTDAEWELLQNQRNNAMKLMLKEMGVSDKIESYMDKGEHVFTDPSAIPEDQFQKIFDALMEIEKQ